MRRRVLVFVLFLIFAACVKRNRISRIIRGTVLPCLLSVGGRCLTLLDALIDTHFIKTVQIIVSKFSASAAKTAATYNLTNIFVQSDTAAAVTNFPSLVPVALPRKASKEPSTIYLSFSGCSWQLFYHLGVATAFLEYFPHSTYVCAGSSCGTIAATALVDRVPLPLLIDFAFKMLHTVKSPTNPMKPFGTMTSIVEGGLRTFLTEGVADRCAGRLFCSLSLLVGILPPRCENRLVGTYASDEGLIHTVLSSCYIPFYYETSRTFNPNHDEKQKVEEEGVDILVLDGGLTNNHPAVPGHEGETIFVCPASRDDPRIHIANRRHKSYPALISIIPGDEADCRLLLRHGKEDATAFIQTWISAEPC